MYSPIGASGGRGSGLLDIENVPDLMAKGRRRVSGFVPMRGKKDNNFASIPAGSSLYIGENSPPPREMDQELSISRLAALESAAAAAAASRGTLNQATSGNEIADAFAASDANWQPVVAVPRQFFYQMANHHQQQHQQQQQEQTPTALSIEQPLNGSPSGINFYDGSWGQQPTNSMLMEAKLRRAFHPMRGKRFSAPISALD